MAMTRQILVFFFIVFSSDAALADWASFGVATRCDPVSATFEISPVVELSSPDPAEVPVKEGFTQLPEGKNDLTCQLPIKTVSVTIRVYGPSGGECMGGGYVTIDRLWVGEVSLIGYGTPFNWHCTPPGLMLVKLVVHETESQISLETCTAKDWNWGTGFIGIKCTSERVSMR